MRKHKLTVALVLTLSACMTLPSCIGSFSLTNKLLAWNKQVSNKFVNELVFFAFWIIPVYEVSALADFLVINSIEFWSGSNPVAANSTRRIQGNDGTYLVSNDKDGYTIKSETDGSIVRLDFNADDRSWSVTTPDGNTQKVFTFVDDDHIALPAPGNEEPVVIETSQAGLYAYQAIATGADFAMNR